MLFNLFGLITGLTHEAIVPIFFVVYLVYILVNYKKLKHSLPKTIFLNIGIFIGFAICFFCPGNQLRAQSEHDFGLMHRSFFQKLVKSLFVHFNIVDTPIMNSQIIKIILLLIVLAISILVIVYLIKNKSTVLFKKCLPFACGCIASIFIWSFSSYVPSYGTVAFRTLYLITIFIPLSHILEKFVQNKKTKVIVNSISILSCLFIFTINFSWMKDLYTYRTNWNNILKHSDSNATIELPAFPESCNNAFTMHNYINIQMDDTNTKKLYDYFYDRNIIIVK